MVSLRLRRKLIAPAHARGAATEFSRFVLRSEDFWLQNSAILCNAMQTSWVRITDDSQCCATQRKRAQFVRLELQISRSEPTELCRRIYYANRCNKVRVVGGLSNPLFNTGKRRFVADTKLAQQRLAQPERLQKF